MRLAELVATSRAVAETPRRLEKIDRLADLLRRSEPGDVPVVLPFLAGVTRQGRLGLGGAALRHAADTPAADASTLTLEDVDRAFERIAGGSGAGSASVRAQVLRDLLSRATSDEKDFLFRLIAGELRQGALEGVLVDAVARAASVDANRLRRASMLAGDLVRVAAAALGEGDAALGQFVLQPFQPVEPMLADSAEDVRAAATELGEMALEYKLDGARIQVHKVGDVVRVYSRALRDVTPAVPEVVEVVRALPVHDAVLDGEALALRSDATPHPFQITMRRFGRKLDVDRLRRELPISPFFFDALYAEGAPLIDEPLSSRAAALAAIVPPAAVVPRIMTARAEDAEAFLERALEAGHEGVMAKAATGRYAAGRRGGEWLKIKPAHTLDLVVLAAEWGHGRRRGFLSNLHLGARDAASGRFVMLGKTFKGMTDEMLSWQTPRLLAIELGRDDWTVYVKPELVVEIAFNDVQASPHYPGGLALRFARVKRYRTDKRAAEADTFEAIQALYRRTTRTEPPPHRIG